MFLFFLNCLQPFIFTLITSTELIEDNVGAYSSENKLIEAKLLFYVVAFQ